IYLGVIASLAVSGAMAQQSGQSEKVEKIEVTGSNIKRIDNETTAPIEIITKKDIEKTGKATVAEVIRSNAANTGNSYNETFTNSFSPGASGAALRGLSQKNVLVLINGRRMASYGFAQNLQDTYVDLNALPTSAVERIEILKDGASAIYGSDAVAGVINVILRKDYTGAEIAAKAGTSSEGGMNEYGVNLTAGKGSMSQDKFNVLATLDYFHRDLTLLSERDFTKDQDFRKYGGGAFDWGAAGFYRTAPRQPFAACNGPGQQFPGSIIRSNGTVCLYNPAPFLTAFPKTDRIASLVRGTMDFNAQVSGFAELSVSHNKTFQKFTPAALGPTSVAYDPATGGVVRVSNVLPVGNPANPFATPTGISYTFFDVGSRDSEIKTTSGRILAGLKGTAGNWDWESAFTHSQSKTDQSNLNRVDRFALTQAIADGSYNFLAPSAAASAALRINPKREADSKLDSIDARVTSELMQLASGPLGFAAGVEHRRESIDDNPDVLITTGRVLGQGSTGTNGSRSNTAAFVEFSVPVLKQVELSLATRYDKYSDFGSAVSPKAGFKWRANKEILLRGSYSKSFRAPTLPEIAPSSSTFFVNVVDTDPTSPNADQVVSIAGVFASNPNLKAERSENVGVGILFEPNQDFNFGFDYYRILQTNVVGSSSFQTIIDNPANFPGQIVRDPTTNALVAVFDKYRNLSVLDTNGLDFSFSKAFRTAENGRFMLRGLWSFLGYFKTPLAEGEPLTDFAGNNGFGSLPKYRMTNTFSWEKGPWETALTHTYINSFGQEGASVPPASKEVSAYRQYDMFASYAGFKNWKLSGSIQNVLNEQPKFDPSSSTRFDFSQHDLRGRYYTVGARYTF
ncbi:MAG: TonB-dependent receptor, partial [Burkholderiales bacterium]